MKNKYDFARFKDISSNTKLNDFDKMNLLKSYIEDYPEDVRAINYCSFYLYKFGYHEEGLELIEDALIYKQTDEIMDKLIESKMKFYVALGRYKEAYQLLTDNLGIFQAHNEVDILLLFLRKRLGITNNDYDGRSYLFDQINNYSEDSAIYHIKKHCSYKNDIFSKFDYSVDINDLFYKVKAKLDDSTFTYKDTLTKHYVFRYDNVGKVEGKNSNFIGVIALIDSNEIITMYPDLNIYNQSVNELQEKKEEYSGGFTRKRISQIDKFNQRYNK